MSLTGKVTISNEKTFIKCSVIIMKLSINFQFLYANDTFSIIGTRFFGFILYKGNGICWEVQKANVDVFIILELSGWPSFASKGVIKKILWLKMNENLFETVNVSVFERNKKRLRNLFFSYVTVINSERG